MSTNPIKYTSTDFQSVINDINSDAELVDKPEWFKRQTAGSVDVLAMLANYIAAQRVLDTATVRQSAAQLLELIDYQISPHSTSAGNLIFYLDPDVSFPVTILQADLAAQSQGSLAVSAKRFEARNDHTQTLVAETFTADAGTNELTIAEEYLTGFLVRLTTTGTLPDPLQIDTDYYVVSISATKIKLAENLTDAYAGDVIDITDTGSGTHTITQYSFYKTVYQQESLQEQVLIGESNGINQWQEYDLPDLKVLYDTLEIWINAELWTRIDNFVDYDNNDKIYKVIYKDNNQLAVRFGNGVYGAIPGNFEIYAQYSYGGGADSNITVINRLNTYAGTDQNITGVSNPSTITGGSNEESLTNAKRLGPLLLKARDRFVTEGDGEALALSFPGVARAQVNGKFYGILKDQVVIVPNGGGLPSTELKNNLKTYLQERTIERANDVRVEDPTYVTVNVTASMKVLPGYTYAGIEDFFELALRLYFSEVTQEIIDDYLQNGISSAITFINNQFSFSFTGNDSTQISRLLDPFGDTAPVDFGVDIQQSDVIGYLDTYIIGCDYVIITVPSFPVTLDANETTQDGTMTLSEIT